MGEHMKKIAAVIGAAALLAVPATASAGNGYGKTINDECGASFGQLRQLSPHPVTPSKGAKYFVENVLASHCNAPS
jgi:hypothetical protein